MKNITLSLCVFVALNVVQLLVVYMLYPNSNDFAPFKKITGVYSYDAGKATSSVNTRVNGHLVFCRFSFMGPEASCFHRNLNGMVVTAQLAHYRHLFGEGEALVDVSANEQIQIHYSAEQLVENWRFSSIIAALLNALIAAVFFYLIRKLWFTDGKKNGNNN
jgi:hypothetical protein